MKNSRLADTRKQHLPHISHAHIPLNTITCCFEQMGIWATVWMWVAARVSSLSSSFPMQKRLQARPQCTEYIFYCKRAILFLSSSKILTPIPLFARRVCPPPATKAGGTHSPGGEGDGGREGQYFGRRENRIALLQ
jgi:hypothetical protein